MGLKCRLIEPTHKVLRVGFYKEGEPYRSHEFPKKYPLDFKHEDLDVDFDSLENELEERPSSYSLRVVYNTDSGKPEPGDMFWRYPIDGSFHWDNSDGKELHVILPNGIEWNIDSRACNCNRKNDRTHRCWVRTGEPPNITVGKGGNTCSAGAGSIQAGDYHGFLRNGEFT